MDKKDLWLRVLTEISLQISRAYFITYFKDSTILGIGEDGVIIIGVPRPMFLDWHLEHSQSKILDILKKFLPDTKEIIFQVDGTLENDSVRAVDILKAFKEKPKGRKIKNKLEVRLANGITSKIFNPKYTLANFVIGSHNQMAHAASSAVANDPGAKYNPLFIYGGVGLGKTHLLQAIGNEIIKHDSDRVVVYVTSENFTNEVVEALQSRKMEQLRKKYRNVDVLMIDDIQFFAGKDRTQEEFFHTLNTLYDNEKQLIFSSDKPPKELDGIEERVKSRCEWGMTADLKMPDFETRLAILHEKVKAYQALISSEVLEFIAFNVHHSVRELEGILMQVVAMIELEQKTPTVEAVAEIIKKLNKNIQLQGINDFKPVLAKDMDSIVSFVADYYNVTISEILGEKRTREIMLPRQVSMYFCKHNLGQSLKKIGDFFGGRDHTSVIHAIKKLEGDLKKDDVLKKDVKQLKKEMGI